MRTSKEGLSRKDLLLKAGAVLTLGASALGMTGCSPETGATEADSTVATTEAGQAGSESDNPATETGSTQAGATPSAEAFFESPPQAQEVSGELPPEQALVGLINLMTEQQLSGQYNLVADYRNSPEAAEASNPNGGCAIWLCIENYAKRRAVEVSGEYSGLIYGANVAPSDPYIAEQIAVDQGAIAYTLEVSLKRMIDGNEPLKITREPSDITCTEVPGYPGLFGCSTTLSTTIENNDPTAPDGTVVSNKISKQDYIIGKGEDGSWHIVRYDNVI